MVILYMQENYLKIRIFLRSLSKDVLSALDLTAVNLISNCKGPKHTYESSDSFSLIDYICVDSALLENLGYSEVVNMHSDNITHHLPVKATLIIAKIHVHDSPTERSKAPPKIKWKKCTVENIERYKAYLETELSNLNGELLDDADNIEKYARAVSKSIQTASSVLPHVTYKRHIKPYWNTKLNTLRNIVATKRKAWITNGRPRGENYRSYSEYKEAKRMFRREQRRCIEAYTQKEFAKISNAFEHDYDSFWKLVNSRKRKKKDPPTLEVDEKLVHDPKEIAELWADYFENLHKPSGVDNTSVDARNVEDIEFEILSIAERRNECDDILASPFTVLEIENVVSNLPNGKAPGHDAVCYEHVKYAGSTLLFHLVLLFNAIVALEYVPNVLN